MSGPTEPGSPPPEVPEEFAAAYRAAYEQALAAQTDAPQHREDPEPEPPENDGEDGSEGFEEPLPERRGRIIVGTHRTESDEYGPTWFEKVRDSSWFVPLLLALLAMLLILGAYALGRSFAGQVQSDAGTAERSALLKPSGADGASTWSPRVSSPGAA